jgi:hypothetical protein
MGVHLLPVVMLDHKLHPYPVLDPKLLLLHHVPPCIDDYEADLYIQRIYTIVSANGRHKHHTTHFDLILTKPLKTMRLSEQHVKPVH